MSKRKIGVRTHLRSFDISGRGMRGLTTEGNLEQAWRDVGSYLTAAMEQAGRSLPPEQRPRPTIRRRSA